MPSDYIDDEIKDDTEAEIQLRRVLAYARAKAAEHRLDPNPLLGRGYALVATHTEDALRTLVLPTP